MTTQPEALRLADSISRIDTLTDHQRRELLHAAAELRRLSGENEAIKAERDEDRRREYGYSQQVVDALTKERDVLRAQRDALLEALKSTGLFLHHCWCDVQMNDYSFEKLNQQMAVVDAAIKQVEGENT